MATLSMTDIPKAVPSTPDPAVISQVAVILRHLITAASTLGLVQGTYSDSTLTMAASALVLLGNAAYALYDLYKKKRLDHAGNVMSAKIGSPVQPAASS